METSIQQVTLENGLKILLKEIHNAPLISHWVWYRVGSRYEVAGKTGISHWVEHMQFKGTPRFPAGILDKAISRDGGMWNAFTHLDWTTYFETMPADAIDLAISLEADRMRNSTFEPGEVDSERTVVISELEGNQNEPLFLLDEAVQSAAFDSHPYRNEVIGSLADLRSITRDDLYQHYRQYYNPANAVVAVAGDFESGSLIEKIRQAYASIPGHPLPPPGCQPEAPLRSEQRLMVNGPGETTYLQLVYRSPAASEEDFFVFTIIDSLLTGPTSLNMFGGGAISNKTSRLYRRLVEKEYAISVNGSLQATADPFLYNITITVHPSRSPEEVLEQVDKEFTALRGQPPTQAEIDRSAKQARALFAYGSENITNQGFWMGYSEIFADHSWFTGYTDRLSRVTVDDVQRVLLGRLNSDQRVVGTYQPDGAHA